MKSEIEIITWSYRSLSLLAAFKYRVEKLENDFINIYKDTMFRYGAVVDESKFICQTRRDNIVYFLIKQGHAVAFGKNRDKKINL